MNAIIVKIDASIVERIKERLDEVLEENTYRINEF